MSWVKFTAVQQFPSGFRNPAVSYRMCGATYEIPLPFQEVSGPVVLTPLMEPDEQSCSVSLRLDRWVVLHLDRRRQLPVAMHAQAGEVRIARDFEADPGISWDSDEFELQSWVSAWLERNNTSRTGGDR